MPRAPAQVEEKRKDLFTLYKNLAKIAFLEALAFVGGLLHAVVAAGAGGGGGQGQGGGAGGAGQQGQGARWQVRRHAAAWPPLNPPFGCAAPRRGAGCLPCCGPLAARVLRCCGPPAGLSSRGCHAARRMWKLA